MRAPFVLLRDELLVGEAFDTLLEAKVLIERWRQHSNTIRPHSALGYRPPVPESLQPCAVAEAQPQRPLRHGETVCRPRCRPGFFWGMPALGGGRCLQ